MELLLFHLADVDVKNGKACAALRLLFFITIALLKFTV